MQQTRSTQGALGQNEQLFCWQFDLTRILKNNYQLILTLAPKVITAFRPFYY